MTDESDDRDEECDAPDPDCYCEYHIEETTTGPVWVCHYASPPYGYACKERVYQSGHWGSYTCFAPVKIPKKTRPPRPCNEFCTYVYSEGKYYLVAGSCGCGNYCPTDLLAYLEDRDAKLHSFLKDNPPILGITIHPACPPRVPDQRDQTR